MPKHSHHSKFPFHGHHPPPWWPENEPWPHEITQGARLRIRFFRRLGCLLAIFINSFIFLFIFAQLIATRWAEIIKATSDHRTKILPLMVLLVVIGIVLVVSLITLLRKISTPLGDLLEASSRLAEGDYTTRVREYGPPEIRSLVHAFNTMTSRLQITEEQRRNFLADVTHELNTPLTVIQGNLEGILDGVYPPDETYLKSMLDETRVLARLVGDLRTLSLAESGKLSLVKEATDLTAVMSEVVDAFQAQAIQAGVSLETKAIDNLPLLEIDPERMRQVFSNLVTNALRYTPEGGRVDIQQTLERDRSQVAIRVHNSGAGISPADLPHIFERFYKSRDSGGMGLGLAIVKYLVEAHGGTIRADSPPGQGTTFIVTLPTSI